MPAMETGVSIFHFSIKADGIRPLNYSHEYQVVYIEHRDGTHVFEIQLGEHLYEQTCHGNNVLMASVFLHRLSFHQLYVLVYTTRPERPRFQGPRPRF